jgi:L-rhamnonate dehydratase
LIGKIRKEPVYALLGGKTKDRLPVYCTTARPDLAKAMGFVASKVTFLSYPLHPPSPLCCDNRFASYLVCSCETKPSSMQVPCPYGPSAGDAGLRKNVEFFKGWREKVGPDFPLMLDCYMALTVPYTISVWKHRSLFQLFVRLSHLAVGSRSPAVQREMDRGVSAARISLHVER